MPKFYKNRCTKRKNGLPGELDLFDWDRQMTMMADLGVALLRRRTRKSPYVAAVLAELAGMKPREE